MESGWRLRPRAGSGAARAAVAALLLLAAWHVALPAEGPPRLKLLEGSATSAPLGEPEWTDVRAGHALRAGDRLWTDAGSRVEIVRAGHSLRLEGASHLTLDGAGPGRMQWSLRQGSLIARVGPLAPGEDVEIDTPNLAFRPTLPGLYRLDVDRTAGTTRVEVLQGAGIAWGEQGQSVALPVGHRRFRGRALAGDPAALAAQPSSEARRPQAAVRHPQQAQRRREREQERRKEASSLQQRALAERWRREQEDWLRFQHGLPPAPRGIPARRAG